jgi:hypothetical protein
MPWCYPCLVIGAIGVTRNWLSIFTRLSNPNTQLTLYIMPVFRPA